MSMLNLNQAHVEAICSATYLENYLDCLDSLPDELQRILTQIREVDVKLSELEKETTPFEDVFVSLKDGETPDGKFVSQLQRMLLRMQEFEDEKIQLSSSLMEYIENRTKQLESDRENLDPSNHVSNDPPSSRGNNSNKRNGGTTDTKNLSTVQSSASGQSVDSSKDNSRQMDHRVAANSAKKRKPKMETTVASSKSSVNSKSNQSTTNHHSNMTNSHSHKDETPAKKHSSTVSTHEATKAAAKLITKRKRRSRAGAQAKCQKEVAVTPTEPEEPTYCTCDQVSYGEMIGCDNDACPIEWFHFDCVGLATKPKGKWFCPKCRGDKQTVMRRGADKGR